MDERKNVFQLFSLLLGLGFSIWVNYMGKRKETVHSMTYFSKLAHRRLSKLAHRKLRARIYFPRKHTGKVWITEW